MDIYLRDPVPAAQALMCVFLERWRSSSPAAGGQLAAYHLAFEGTYRDPQSPKDTTVYMGKGFAKVDTREQNRPHLAVIISLFSHGLELFLDQMLLANRRRLRRYHGCHITLRSRNYNKPRTPATTRDTEALRSLICMQSPLPASQWRNKHGQARYRLSHGSSFPLWATAVRSQVCAWSEPPGALRHAVGSVGYVARN